ncbi:MAG TPA: EamA family transporter, partial [Terriglobales bacterium]|nr:EamA family transporter [Terriglobales bacterium]
MTPAHVLLTMLVVVIWGVAFVATRIALDVFSAPQLTALRFLIAAAPAVWLARPPLPWRTLTAVGLSLFAGQFLFQFFGIALGMPPGLASVVVQTQALFTILFSALALGERPSG